MDPREISIQAFNYHLPEHRIARYPLEARDASKLLIYKKQEIAQDIYAHLAEHLPPQTLLFFNNTKVVEARLLFTKSTGGAIELLCLEPHEGYADIATAMSQKNRVLWNCLVGGAKKWKADVVLKKEIRTADGSFFLSATMIQKNRDSCLIELSWDQTDIIFADVLHAAGLLPLPPYLNRSAETSDKERYQTVYAKHDGSVAAPTAGLHFTKALIDKLNAHNIEHDFVTLHVGAGTFKAVKSETLDGHEMHAECIDVTKDTIARIIARAGHPIIPVGTTSCRTLESIYWMGVKAVGFPNANIDTLEIKQWDAYELPQDMSRDKALNALLDWMHKKNTTRIICKTQILITPEYRVRMADAIITNFHQPNSTLLLLIAAFVGDDWKSIYDYALANDFRFLSYGDGCLLWNESNITYN